jgi:hypothetical protein
MCDVILIVQIPVHLYMHFFALLSVAVRVVGVCLRLHAQIMRINGDSLTTSWPLPYFLELPPKGNYLDMRDIASRSRTVPVCQASNVHPLFAPLFQAPMG